MNKIKMTAFVLMGVLALSAIAPLTSAQEINSDKITPSYIDYKSLPVPSHKQEKSNWCWAATSQMAIEHLGGNKTQSQIVKYIKGSLVNKGGTDKEVKSALAYGGLNSTIDKEPIPFGTIISQIKRNQPQLAHIVWKDDSDLGHMYLINGYSDNTNLGFQKVYYKDPAVGEKMDKIDYYDGFVNNRDFSWYSTINEIYVN
ncbi:papain-like cysteine protease family protein [Paenibacillus sp. FSL M8-0228]|jgi:hypothetical protein|uniref:C39 family peptidase n=1 Tax=Paenibacillus TaxID=44249 RepID=UPI000AFDC9FA|nr:papain-like cysteine protease family protein [Paenibacillus polymyxa]